MSFPRLVQLSFLIFSALLSFTSAVFAALSQKEAELVPEKKIEPKKKYAFIGKLLEKAKIEDEKKQGDKNDDQKKGKKGKKGKRSLLLKFQVKEVISGQDKLKPGALVLCVTEPGPLRNPNQVKRGQTELGGVYRIITSKKWVQEDKVLRLADCRLFSAKGRVGEEYKIAKFWNGSLPVKSLELLPADQRQSPIGYFGDNKSFTEFLNSFKPLDKKFPSPRIDFSKNVVVLIKNIRHPEPITGLRAWLEKDALRVTPKRDFEFDGRKLKGEVFAAFFILPRKGIKILVSGKKHEFEIKPPGFIYAD